MAERYYNPFQSIDINLPNEYREVLDIYCQTGKEAKRSIIDKTPFPRMVDMWFLSLAIATRKKLKPIDLSKKKTYKVIDGAIFSSDPWRINMIMLLCIGFEDDIEIVNDPRRMMKIASGLAVAGLPYVIDMLKDQKTEPIWNLSYSIEEILREKDAK
jgi:hypothetical protein